MELLDPSNNLLDRESLSININNMRILSSSSTNQNDQSSSSSGNQTLPLLYPI